MEDRTPDSIVRQVLLTPHTLETDRSFYVSLAQAACTGLRWCGRVGVLGVLILVGVQSLVLGRPTTLWYPDVMTPEHFVLWDKVAVLLVCVGTVGLGRLRRSLVIGRWGGAAFGLAIAAISLVHDAYRGILSIEYVLLAYLLTVVAVPYRPWQALLLGGGMCGLLYGIGTYGVPGTAAAVPSLIEPGQVVRMVFTTIVLTGVAALLYLTRYRQHHARREAERLHRQVASLERAKSAFFADLSHAFRTPLTLLLGTLRRLQTDPLPPSPSALRDRFALMEQHARTMERLVNELLDLTKLDEGRLSLAAQQHDLAALIDRWLPPFRQWADNEGLSLQVNVPSHSVNVWIDADRFEHVVGNLLSNAIKYTPEGGTIRLQVTDADDAVALSVRDTGPGLPESIQSRVFDRHASHLPARREGPSATRSTNAAERSGSPWMSMGIGLAHTRALVERHGGHITVETEQGFGTEFTVRLPQGADHLPEADRAEAPEDASTVAPMDVDLWKTTDTLPADGSAPPPRPDSAASSAEEAPSADASAEPPDDAPRILIVDDSDDMRVYLCRLLGPRYRIVTASDGSEGLQRLRDERFDLVISDVVMPECDGVSLCKAIRDDTRLRHLPVILLTGQSAADARLSGLQAGADAYVQTPFDPAELEARVENLIEIRQMVQDRVRLPDWMEPTASAVAPDDAAFVETATEIVDDHIGNSNFGVAWLADEMDLSARHLRRRLKDVTRLSPGGFIRARRLRHAAALLRQGADSIADVADAVGYRDAGYFSRLFRETFGCSPTDYAAQEQTAVDEPDDNA